MGWQGPSRATSGLILAAAAALAGASLGISQRPSPVAPVDGPGPPLETVATIEVHVAGWVGAPGVVELPEGAIVADAVAAAGGMRLGARADLVNLAAPLRSGDQVVIPGPDGADTGSGSASGPGNGLISVNQATASELEALPGVGPVLAERIVAHREQVGGFDRVEDLLQVPGIGESKLAAIRDLVRVP
jgi:competence protein ComEA